MLQSYSDDPRLQKRPASTSPEATARDPKRPALEIRDSYSSASAAASNSNNNNNIAAQSNGITSSHNFMAGASRTSRNEAIVDLKMRINLQTVATSNCQFKYDHADSQLKCAQADYDSHKNRNNLSKFPALKEVKSAAVDRARKNFKEAQKPLETARAELRRLTGLLVDLEQSGTSPAATSHDTISRAEFEELKNELSSVKKDLSSAISNIESCKHSQDLATKTIEDFQAELDSQDTDLDNLRKKTESVTRTIATHVEETLKGPQNDLVELRRRLDSQGDLFIQLQQRLKRNEDETASNNEAVIKGSGADAGGQHASAESLQKCVDRIDKMEPVLDKTADKGALALVQQTTRNLQESHHQLQASLQQLQASLQQLSEQVNTIKTTQDKITTNLQKGNPPTNGVPPDLTTFRPVPGGDLEDDINPFHARPTIPGTLRAFENKDLHQMKADIEALKNRVQDNTNRYNNLLSDQLAQKMLDNLNHIYPNLKEVGSIARTVGELQGRVGAVSTDRDALKTTLNVIGQDMQKLQSEVKTLEGRVGELDKDIQGGKVVFVEMEDRMKGVENMITRGSDS